MRLVLLLVVLAGCSGPTPGGGVGGGSAAGGGSAGAAGGGSGGGTGGAGGGTVELTTCAAGAPCTFDVRAVEVSGRITINGAAPVLKTGSPQCSQFSDGIGRIVFRDTLTGREARASLGCAAQAPFSILLAPATYQVRFENGAGANGPQTDAVLSDAFAVSGALTGVTFDVPSIPVSGRFTVNAAAPVLKTGSPQCSQYTDGIGRLIFKHTTTGAAGSASLGCNAAATFSAALVPGTYEVRFENGGGANGPAPVTLLDAAFAVTGPLTNVVFDAAAVTVSGSLSINGAAPVLKTGSPQCSQYSDGIGRLDFENVNTRATTSVALGCNAGATFSHTLAKATYRVSFINGGGANGPSPKTVINPSFAVTGALSNVVFDARAVTVSGRLTVNSAAPVVKTGSPQCSQYSDGIGRLTFRSSSDAETSVSLGCDPNAAFSIALAPGTYEVGFQDGGGANGPGSRSVIDPSFVVSGALSNVMLDVRSIPVSAGVTFNGAPPVPKTGSPQCSQYGNGIGTLSFENIATEARTQLSLGCATTPGSVLLAPGTYRVWFRNGGGADGPEPDAIVNPSLAVNAPLTNVMFDVRSVSVHGALTVNGAAPVLKAGSPSCAQYTNGVGSLVLESESTRATVSVPLGCTPGAAFSVAVVPDTYQLRFINGGGGNGPAIETVIAQRIRF